MRWAAYAGVSATLAVGVLVKAFSQRPNYYSATLYLAQSNANLMILTNFIFLCACVSLLGLQKLLYGPLRPIEIEQLYERGWLFVTETCLSMTIFRGSFGAWFMVMFFSLLVGKVWSWIGEGRVEIFEQQPPANPALFHTRLSISLLLSSLFAVLMMEFCVDTVVASAKADMMVMFSFEFAILSVSALSTTGRYIICLAEIAIIQKQKKARVEEMRAERAAANEASVREGREAPRNTPDGSRVEADFDETEIEVEGWDSKGHWILYLDLVTDFLRLTMYIAFFLVLLRFYGPPLYIVRDLFLSFRSFVKRVADFMRYRRATRDMNTRYPDATADEVGREDVCIICREEMRPALVAATANDIPPNRRSMADRMRPKKLPCGHVLHFSCLRSWLERQQNCPTCRRPVVVAPPAQRQGGQDPALQQNGNQNPGGEGLPGNQHGQAGRNRARVINLGPLRIGFGAGGGNMIDDLAQRLRNGEQGPPVADAGNQGGQRHYGFGFQFGRRRPAPNQDRPAPAILAAPNVSVQSHLDHVERTIQAQLSSLSVAQAELHIVRQLNQELYRLRRLRADNTAPSNIAGQEAGARSSMAIPLGSAQTAATGHHSQSTMLSGQPQQNLGPGSEGLPAGVTLPPGWTLMPLQRHEGNLRNVSHNNGAVVNPPGTNTAGATPPRPFLPVIQPVHPRTQTPDDTRPQSHGVGSGSSGAPAASPENNPNLRPTVNPALPSWGSAPHATNGNKPNVTQPPEEVLNREGDVDRSTAEDRSGPAKDSTSDVKGKAKAATVEEGLDDLD